MLIAILQFLGLAAVIVVAGSILAQKADEIAEITGWGRMLVGGVLLAGATSLPELTVDITAVKLGLADLAAGDLLGSSLMNLLILAVLDLSHYSRGKMLSRVAAGHALSGLLSIALPGLVGVAILVTATAVMGQLYHVEGRRRLIEPDALLMLLLIVGSLVLVYRSS